MQYFTKINKKKRITSYEHLNKKYDLNFSDYNFGFDWEVFKDFVGNSYARYFTSPTFFKFVSAGRGTNKTWNHLAEKLFFACSFTDASSNILRRYANTHEDTTFGDTINVCKYLYDKCGIYIGPDNENGVVWPKNVKEGGEIFFLVVFAFLLWFMLIVIELWIKLVKVAVLYQPEQMKWYMRKKKKGCMYYLRVLINILEIVE
ncbi:MAG: hypothetical protein OHM56_04645 [Spiroplasma phoeniceum]|nr:MAG: hypothetical protein OHM57_04045 [Spiroplasma phoeniceum]UZQ33233.1 MAG: hypothetical protein OHM56_04645 [Spiroplasma phoeniceum]